MAVGPLAQQATGPLPNLCVKDFFVENKWDVDSLNAVLPHNLVQDVLTLHFDNSIPDKPLWQPSGNGLFSVSSAFNLIRRRSTPQTIYRLFWHTQIPLKISYFFWRVLKSFLHTEDKQMEWGLNVASRCYLCYSESESIAHALFTCKYAIDVWKSIISYFGIITLPNIISMDAMIKYWFRKSGNKTNHVKTFVPVIVSWHLWTERNNRKHRNTSRSPKGLVLQAIEDLKNWGRASPYSPSQVREDEILFKGSVKKGQRKHLHLAFWHSPSIGFLKLNVDGSLNSNYGGGGGLLRDVNGNMLWCFGFPSSHKSIELIELEAIVKGMELCKSHGFNQVLVETDSQIIAKCLVSHSVRWDMWNDISWAKILLRDTKSSISHIWRECNRAADYVAKKARDSQSSFFHASPLFHDHDIGNLGKDFIRIIKDDLRHIPFVRCS